MRILRPIAGRLVIIALLLSMLPLLLWIAHINPDAANAANRLKADAIPTVDRCPYRAADVLARVSKGTRWADVIAAVGSPQRTSQAGGFERYPHARWPKMWPEESERHEVVRAIYWNPQDGENAVDIQIDTWDNRILMLYKQTYPRWFLDRSRLHAAIGKTPAQIGALFGVTCIDASAKPGDICDYIGRGADLSVHLGSDGRADAAEAHIVEPL